jgi:hypothetical protein
MSMPSSVVVPVSASWRENWSPSAWPAKNDEMSAKWSEPTPAT